MMTPKVRQPLSKDAKHSHRMKTRYPTPRRTTNARSSRKGCRLFTTAGTYTRPQVSLLRKTAVRREKQDVHPLNFSVDCFPHKRKAYCNLFTRVAITIWSKLLSAFYPAMKRLWLASSNQLPWVYLDVPNLCHPVSRRFCPIP